MQIVVQPKPDQPDHLLQPCITGALYLVFLSTNGETILSIGIFGFL